MNDNRTLILNHAQVQQKLRRIAYQIMEFNFEEPTLVVAGVAMRGYRVAEKLTQLLREISKQEIHLLKITLDKDEPLDSEPVFEGDLSLLDVRPVILVDDVLNTGKTLMYAAGSLIKHRMSKLTTVVLVDRKHRKYPVKADFVGLTLSTTIQDHISVEFSEAEVKVFLE